MAINTLEFAGLLQTSLDKQVEAEATTGWMELNASKVRYSGGDEVKIPKLSMDGLADYDRDKGFKQGSVSLTWETRKLTQDRAKTFMLDSMDIDETAFVANAAAVMSEFQRREVIPEIDAYRYSSIAAQAETAGAVTAGYTPAAATILSKIREDIYKIYDKAGEIPLIITISMPIRAILEGASEITHRLDVGDFKHGEITTRVKMLDGIPDTDGTKDGVLMYLLGDAENLVLGHCRIDILPRQLESIIPASSTNRKNRIITFFSVVMRFFYIF